MHKITPVFNGTPAEVTGGGWPVQLHMAADQIESPVYDSVSGRIFTNCSSGSANGCIESVDISNGFPSGVLSSSLIATSSIGGVGGLVVDNVSSAA